MQFKNKFTIGICLLLCFSVLANQGDSIRPVGTWTNDNLVVFGEGRTIKDSGVNISNIVGNVSLDKVLSNGNVSSNNVIVGNNDETNIITGTLKAGTGANNVSIAPEGFSIVDVATEDIGFNIINKGAGNWTIDMCNNVVTNGIYYGDGSNITNIVDTSIGKLDRDSGIATNLTVSDSLTLEQNETSAGTILNVKAYGESAIIHQLTKTNNRIETTYLNPLGIHKFGIGYNELDGSYYFHSYDSGISPITIYTNGTVTMGSTDTPIDIVGDLQVGNDLSVETGSITLDTSISEWSDIGLTYTNAVRLNPSVIISNDSVWSGWETTGTLNTNTHEILLSSTNQYLLSPILSNGIAHVDKTIYSLLNATLYTSELWTNGVKSLFTIPYTGNDGQLYFKPTGVIPGTTLGLYISNVTVIGYSDISEAAMKKQVSSLQVLSNPYEPHDVATKQYVDKAQIDAENHAANALSSYAADPDKTVRGSNLRLGNMWVVSPSDSSGERFVVSGGEIKGDGELIGTTNEFIISKNDYPLMRFTSSASGLFCPSFTLEDQGSNVVWTIQIATNGVTAEPFVEYTRDLSVGEWSRLSPLISNSYPTVIGTNYVVQFADPGGDTVFTRVMQPEGSSSVTIDTDIFFLKYSKLLINDSTGGVWRIAVTTNGVLTTTRE